MSVNLSPIGNGFQFFTTTGLPLNGGLLYTYQAGSTTPLATYTTSTGNITNANPIVLGTDGRPPQEIWFTAGTSYKFVLCDSSNNQIATYDNLYGLLQQASGNPGSVAQVVQATFNSQSTTTSASYVNTSVTANITPTTSTSKVVITVSASCHIYNYDNEQDIRVIRNGTNEVVGSYRINKVFLPTEGASQENWNPISITVVDQPATTSATTYTVQQRCTNGSSALVGFGSNDTGSSSIVLMEIL
jgi:hypothetical protein